MDPTYVRYALTVSSRFFLLTSLLMRRYRRSPIRLQKGMQVLYTTLAAIHTCRVELIWAKLGPSAVPHHDNCTLASE